MKCEIIIQPRINCHLPTSKGGGAGEEGRVRGGRGRESKTRGGGGVKVAFEEGRKRCRGRRRRRRRKEGRMNREK